MNLLERILSVDWTQPGAIALLGSVAYVLLRELPRALRWWGRLRRTPDPIDRARGEPFRNYKPHSSTPWANPAGVRHPYGTTRDQAQAGPDPESLGRAILGMGDETASERYARLNREALARARGERHESSRDDGTIEAFNTLMVEAKWHAPGPESVLWTSRDGVQSLRKLVGKRPLSDAELDALFDPETGCYRIEGGP